MLPIAVFLVFYLGLGIFSEYIMKIPMGFYNIPIVVAFLLAILTACLQNRESLFDRKLELMAQGVGDKNIITMLLIFLDRRNLRRRRRAKQCRECRLPDALPDSGAFFRRCPLCRRLLCVDLDGHFSRNDHAPRPNSNRSC